MADSDYSRRTYLKRAAAAGVVGMAGVAGCTGGNDGGGSSNGSNGSGGSSNASGGGGGNSSNSGGNGGSGNELEIIHWWTAGGEQDALKALLDGFRKKHPDVGVNNNPAPGGAGSAQDAVVRNRVLNGNPPSTFQIWPGESLTPYIEGDVLEDIGGSVWNDEMRNAYLEGPKKLSQPNGNYVAVPLNIHRLNNLFYNTSVVEEAGVDPSSITDPKALTDALSTVDSETDAVGMAHSTQDAWVTLQLWESAFIGEQGVDAFTDMLNGNVSKHEQGVKSALKRVTEYREYFNEDAGSVAWDQANSGVINGDAAFIHMGDWAAGQYESQDGFAYKNDWNQVPFPGTEGVYTIVVDSFVFPSENPSPDATTKFLKYCGSTDGQRRFNPIKGSIPPRTDVSNEPFGPFLTSQRKDFENSNSQPPTIAHGTGVTPDQKSSMEEAFSGFTENWNVNGTYSNIESAFSG
jgi:glucose/mannose transport system substrate-binding protein